MRGLVVIGCLLLGAGPAAAQSDVRGVLALDLRAYPSKPAYAGQPPQSLYPSGRAEVRYSYGLPGTRDRLVAAAFLRLSQADEGRTHADLREAYWLHRGRGWSVTAGVNKVFWGVTESRHLVDVVNQSDGREDIDGEDKLGQAMLALSFSGVAGTFDAYALPWFRPFKLPDYPARLGGALPWQSPSYDAGGGPSRIDVAARWAESFGDVDLALSYFDGNSREPRLLPRPAGVVPHYDLIRQVGLEFQYTSGDWLWKLEAVRRKGQGATFGAATGGFEWTRYDIAGTGVDLGLIAEYNYDNRDAAQAPPTIYDNDLFAGARLVLNGVDDASVLIGQLIDTATSARVSLIEGHLRLDEDWRVAVEGRFFSATPATDPMSSIRSDDYMQVSIERYF